MKKLGIYIHIPFCIRKCNYCDFCSFAKPEKETMIKYTDELCRRIETFYDANRYSVDTVYFGGGTPTLLPIECFEKLMRCLKSCFDIEQGAEITVECNPASIGFDGLYDLRYMGINRLSIGLQSANENELVALGRLHDFEGFCKTFMSARDAGFRNISVDLMYGIPNQTKESFMQTLKDVCRLSPEHISAYGLKIEEGTPFAEKRDLLVLPSEDEELEMYSDCNEFLSKKGYHRYEISNFAKDGYESRHNLKYWNLDDYIGFGVSAHSYVEGERFSNSRDINAFISGENIEDSRRTINKFEHNEEYVMLSMRCAEGIDVAEYKKRTGNDFITDKLKKYIEMGFVSQYNGRVFFTTKGFLVSNTILSDIIDTDLFK